LPAITEKPNTPRTLIIEWKHGELVSVRLTTSTLIVQGDKVLHEIDYQEKLLESAAIAGVITAAQADALAAVEKTTKERDEAVGQKNYHHGVAEQAKAELATARAELAKVVRVTPIKP